jgi:hypothetical protein
MGDFTEQQMMDAGWTREALAAVRAEGLLFYRVTVLEDCDCPSCRAGRRWFYCTGVDRTIAVYAVPGDGGPAPSVLRQIEQSHPGKLFLY